jgi:hypothetical protein
MMALERIRQQALSLELRFLHLASSVGEIPLLGFVYPNVTAEVRVQKSAPAIAVEFSVRFKSPYFHFPVEVKKSQIGEVDADRKFHPSAFRFFHWDSWTHLDGVIEWLGERRVDIDGETVSVVTGFRYRVHAALARSANFGLRLAEGVEGTVWVLRKGRFIGLRFAPLYWMLEPKKDAFNVIAIKDTELAMLIVSLSDIGSGNPQVYDQAIKRLGEWASFKLVGKDREKAMLQFLCHIRDWGPLGMDPLFPGLAKVLEQMDVAEQERILFDFYADNWGIRNNRHGRLLAVKLLEALGTKKAIFFLQAVSGYVKNQVVAPEELELIRGAIDSAIEKTPSDISLGGKG